MDKKKADLESRQAVIAEEKMLHVPFFSLCFLILTVEGKFCEICETKNTTKVSFVKPGRYFCLFLIRRTVDLIKIIVFANKHCATGQVQ